MVGDSLVVVSKLKEYIKNIKIKDKEGFHVSGDFADTLSKKCEQLIKEACERAYANGRSTVQSRDL